MEGAASNGPTTATAGPLVVSCRHVRSAMLIGVVVACTLVGPAAWSGHLIGSPLAETYGHAWVRWWTTMAWPAWSQGTALALGAASWPVIDPLPTWFFGGVARVVGDTAAWNLCAAAGIVVTAVGGASLARALGGSALFGAGAAPLMPIYLGSIQSGLTEDHFLGVVGLALSAGIERRWIAAGAWSGLAAWCGLYLGWFSGVGLVVIATHAFAARVFDPSRPGGNSFPSALRRAARPLAGLALAASLSAGAAWPFVSRLGGPTPVRPALVEEPLYALNPWRAADLASFVSPGRPATGNAVIREHPTYVGATTLTLATLGGWHPAGFAVMALGVASLGDEIAFRGHATGFDNPLATILHAIPLGARFRNHARLMLLGQLVLVALASRGVSRVARASSDNARRWPIIAGVAAAVAMAFETAVISPAAFPLSTTSTHPPPIYAKVPAGGRPVRVLGERNPQKALFDQRFHGHPLNHDPNRPGGGTPRPLSEVIVAFPPNAADLSATLGEPDATAQGASAWWP